MENIETNNTNLKFAICNNAKITEEEFNDQFNKNVEELNSCITNISLKDLQNYAESKDEELCM